MKQEYPESVWYEKYGILARIEYWLHILAWSKTKDAQHNRNKPVMISPKQKDKKENIVLVTPDELARLFGH